MNNIKIKKVNKLTIEITTTSIAFEDDYLIELASVLQRMIKKFREEGIYGHFLKDTNGNNIGTVFTYK